MIHCIAKRALVAAGLFLAPALAADQPKQTDTKLPEPAATQDQRFSQVRGFFELKKSPLVNYAAAFIEAADRYSLDWRLLPCLAQVESAGGKIIRNNNVFGWGNGRIRFASVPESIHIIAERLANGASYRNKSTEGKLRAYNPRNRRYADHVLEMMALIGPAGAPAAAVTATLEAATAPAN